MIYSIIGQLKLKNQGFAVIENHGIGYKIFANTRVFAGTPVGEEVEVYCHLNVKEDALDLYGFRSPGELRFFELLTSVSGVGPKSALSIMEIAELNALASAIKEGRPDILTKASGIGRKTAERIIIDLRNKVEAEESEAQIKKTEADNDIIETLVGLGYRREQVRVAMEKVRDQSFEGKLKEALKILSGK